MGSGFIFYRMPPGRLWPWRVGPHCACPLISRSEMLSSGRPLRNPVPAPSEPLPVDSGSNLHMGSLEATELTFQAETFVPAFKKGQMDSDLSRPHGHLADGCPKPEPTLQISCARYVHAAPAAVRLSVGPQGGVQRWRASPCEGGMGFPSLWLPSCSLVL